jgi:hypothetical protein
MNPEPADFMDWLHAQRREAEADRKRRGLTGADYLRECTKEAARVRAEVAERGKFLVRDKNR